MLSSQPSPTPIFPIEVFERVIEFCAPWHDDLSANDSVDRSADRILACSLACRDWVPRSQYMLFYDVFLYTQKSVELFISAIHGNIHFGTYVRRLRIRRKHLSVSEKEPQLGSALLLLVGKLRKLQYLDLYELPFYSHSSLPAVVSQYTLVTRLALGGITLHNRRDFLKFIMWFPNLRHLNVRFMSPVFPEQMNAQDINSMALRKYYTTRPNLLSLAIDFGGGADHSKRGPDRIHPLLLWIINSPPLAHLRNLCLSIGVSWFSGMSDTAVSAGQLIGHCAASLQELVLQFDRRGKPPHPNAIPDHSRLWSKDELSLQYNANLHRLTICSLRLEFLTFATYLISSLPEENNIVSISVQILLQYEEDITRSEHGGGDEWNRLDAALSRADFKSLRLVKIHISRGDMLLPYEADQFFPRTERRGVLRVVRKWTEADDWRRIWMSF